MAIHPIAITNVRESVRGMSAKIATPGVSQLLFTAPLTQEICWAEFRVVGGSVLIFVDEISAISISKSLRVGVETPVRPIPFRATVVYFANEVVGETPTLRATFGLRTR